MKKEIFCTYAMSHNIKLYVTTQIHLFLMCRLQAAVTCGQKWAKIGDPASQMQGNHTTAACF